MSFAPPPARSAVPLQVNLFSDTQTRPSGPMREAMARAEVGDEQNGDDPSINALCERMAALLGKGAAMFLPTGTMCNQVASLTWCRPGDEMLAHATAHIGISEGGGCAALGGVTVRGLEGAGGQFDPEAVEAALRPESRYSPPQRLVSAEQTANLAGGTVWPAARLRAVADTAHRHGLATHMDGARLMNAVVASGVPASVMCRGWDSVWLDFTKGLGAPLGAVLAGPESFIDAAWRWKQRLGGALRQGGICAAACLWALDHNVERLAEDHEHARLLARALAALPGVEVELPETNLVFFDVSGTGMAATALADLLRAEGIALLAVGPHRLRACTHLDVGRADVLAAAAAVERVLTAAQE